jgi:hypothetical protein
MTCKSITISGKDHHNEITAKIIKASTLTILEKKALILAKCHDQKATRACHARGSSNLNLETNFKILGIL